MDVIKFIKQEGIDHFKDRLYVHWDVTTLCEYKCTYCYARRQYGDEWGKLGDWKKQQYVIEELSKSSLPVFLGLLGGEPTSHQRYFTLIDRIMNDVITHEDSRLYITSNGHKSQEFYARHPDSRGKIYMLWSLHPEYVNRDQFENFYRNIVLMHEKGYKTKINLMLVPAQRYWEDIKYYYDRLNELDYAILHPHFIYFGINNDVNYKKEFYEYFKFLEKQRVKEFNFFTEDSSHLLSDYEMFSQGLNQFKGWNCFHNNYEINRQCKISDQCFDREPKDIPTDFFKNITEIKSKICPHQFCSCDGLLKIRKEYAKI